MADIIIILKTDNPLEIMNAKKHLQELASNLNNESLKEVAKLSQRPTINDDLPKLLNNSFFKMALK